MATRRVYRLIMVVLLCILVLVPCAVFAQDAAPASVSGVVVSKINSGDTAWILMSTALVMLMTPGLALFYGGMVRRKNVLGTIMHSFIAIALVDRKSVV
jgi:Amt family ammonium transporter